MIQIDESADGFGQECHGFKEYREIYQSDFEAIGIALDEHVWANVDELIAGIAKTRPMNMEILEEIARTDAPGWNPVLPFCQWCLAGKSCSGTIPKVNDAVKPGRPVSPITPDFIR